MRVFVLTMLLLLAVVPWPVSASEAGSNQPPSVGSKADTFQDRVTLEQAVKQVRKRYGGRILSAETRGSGDRRTHVIKVLNDEGRVHTVRIRAN